MCTVTIIPKGNNDFVLTSNRDEAPQRISLAPKIYNIKGVQLMYPKDELSDGTWIGVSDRNRLVCVLNGGFEKHTRKQKYRLSRGVITKEFLISDDILSLMTSFSLEDIEPFTMVLADWNGGLKFYELIWDGQKKHITELPLEPKIWSSSTLYNSSMRQERLEWFESFKNKYSLKATSLLEFHKTAGNHSMDYGVIMDRGFVKTTSITQVEKCSGDIKMIYENLQTHEIAHSNFKLPLIVNE